MENFHSLSEVRHLYEFSSVIYLLLVLLSPAIHFVVKIVLNVAIRSSNGCALVYQNRFVRIFAPLTLHLCPHATVHWSPQGGGTRHYLSNACLSRNFGNKYGLYLSTAMPHCRSLEASGTQQQVARFNFIINNNNNKKSFLILYVLIRCRYLCIDHKVDRRGQRRNGQYQRRL